MKNGVTHADVWFYTSTLTYIYASLITLIYLLQKEEIVCVNEDGIVVDNRQSLTELDGQLSLNFGYDQGFTSVYDLFDLREIDGRLIPEGERRDAFI